ncbi:hypothetical protein AGABI1DRAFT_111078 [Agaricus bisporus var. burnettii JB137-S8]|uniref:Peroxidase n=2 Tax=Agaricus bisporus var. burnettii TaxID=192524 RepID=K5XGQ4_AGABU|nr:uncharacterized protein AGABI1DRAFT_111078 [Agaricus bisporus var. burnettii JB137-S8]EKM82462.1 hypothetical protein AGABI1DRAFT_111078 [Agaricus bisporus var. burnettii JB137-S8]KAF7778527.1 CAZyme family AA2 [Agaricus bisporus var. burnettii]
MHLVKKLAPSALLLQAQLSLAAYHWPSPQYDALETFMYEGQRGDGSNLASLVHPCRKRSGTNASVPAQWLRLAFHDIATYNNDNGTGGLDGSIVYELGREENLSIGFNQSLTDFEAFPNKYVSRADLIALGAIFSVATCQGPTIPFRGGRIDAWTAGDFGTPLPQDDITTLTDSFKRMGFSPSDMVGLIACGHSIGGVTSADEPDIVPPGNDPSKPTIVDFDSTGNFDNKVVTEYLDGSTQNPLVVTSNQTLASDLKIFISDANQTIRSFADPNQYNSQCQTLLERMINTVAHGVSLTDEITMIPAKVHDVQLTIERNQLVFKSSLRLPQPMGQKLNTQRTVTMFWCDRYGDSADCQGNTKSAQSVKTTQDDPNNSPITFNMGLFFVHYHFVVPIDSKVSISKFWFEVDEHNGTSAAVYNNGGDDYVVQQDQVILVPTLSSSVMRSNGSYTQTYTNRVGEFFTKVYNITVAVREGSNPSRVYATAYDSAVANFTYAVNTTFDFTRNSSMSPVGGYEFYSGSVEDSGHQMTLDTFADVDGTTYTDDFRQTTFLDNSPYNAPSDVATKTSTSSSPISFVISAPSLIFGLLLILLPLHVL